MVMILFFVFVTLFSAVLTQEDDYQQYNNDTFPPGFKFGAATSAYQIEGAWNVSGKGPSIWDVYTHKYNFMIVDHSTGDVACASYYKYMEDIKLAEYMGLDYYRFSISWARVLPYGYSNYVNEPGIEYYNNVINELLARNITPMVTIYHWDLPQVLQNIGGWPNPVLIDIFADYARLLFDRFGDRVKMWLTFNEPKHVCALGYGSIYLAPGYVNQSGIADYMCGYTILKAHAKVYHMYKDEYFPTQGGEVSMTIDTTWFQPAQDDAADKEASFVNLMFSFGWFANPIFYKDGNYPQVMIDRIGNRSIAEGFPRSRLPLFTEEEVEYIKGTADFMAVNMYTSALVAPMPESPKDNDISYWNDAGVWAWQPANWPGSASPFVKVKKKILDNTQRKDFVWVCPWGAKDLLQWIKSYYGNYPIIITENGYPDKGELQDYKRINFYNEYLNDIRQAMIESQINVKAYLAWSLIDNFEWIFGYTQKYGLNYVNFTNPERPRKIKNSARCFKKIVKTHQIDWDCTGDEPEEYFES